MATTKERLAEQVRMQLAGSGYVNKDTPVTMQELLIAVVQELGIAVKNSWYQNKNEGLDEINGAFIYTFKNVEVTLDTDVNLYYSLLPSSYVDIPHTLGINLISYMKGQDTPFVMYATGQAGLFKGLVSSGMGGRKKFWVENDKVYYDNITLLDAKPVLMRLAVALDDFDEDYPINISPDIQSVVVQNVYKRYVPESLTKKDNNIDNS